MWNGLKNILGIRKDFKTYLKNPFRVELNHGGHSESQRKSRATLCSPWFITFEIASNIKCDP